MVIKPKRNNAQHQPLTTVLRNIVREYPAGGGVLRELCQNADDSGATAIEFILDPTHHPTDPLLHPEGGLAEFQGPSLLAYNNSTFSERDFRSLSKIGDSEKLHDLNSTGRFGRGFNSVYNWTDNPSILSGSSLLILDPHQAWSKDVGEPGGPLWDFVQNCEEPEMINQMAPFKCLVGDISRSFEGTIIRLPLRTAEQGSRSEIVRDMEKKSIDIDDIKEVFELFSAEMAEYLLFLRHISSIKLKIGDKVFAEAVSRKYSCKDEKRDITESFTIDDAYQSVLVQGVEKSQNNQFIIEISFLKNDERSTALYAVTHHMRHAHPDAELHEWSRRYKLLPWAAIASPISENSLRNFTGKLFSTLPLPISSQHPTHIHAMFSITPDRASIHRNEDSTVSEKTETKRGSRWNRWIFEELVVSAWVANLQFISHLTKKNECAFAGWNVWPFGGKEQGTLGVKILEEVFKRVMNNELRLLPTIGGQLANPSAALFAPQLAVSLEEALREASVVVVFPPNDRREQLSQLSYQYSELREISPTEIRLCLSTLQNSSQRGEGFNAVSAQSKSVLLDYILSDADYQDIGQCEARLLPTLAGTYQAFKPFDRSVKIRFARSKEELNLFHGPNINPFVIDKSKLSSDSLHHFNNRIDSLENFTSVSRWDLKGAEMYCRSSVFQNDLHGEASGRTIVWPGIIDWVNRLWSWAVALDRNGAISAFEGLWLLPLTGNRYLKLTPDSIILDVSGNGPVAQIFRQILSSHPVEALEYHIYTNNNTMSRENTGFFREAEFIYDCEELHNIVSWLLSWPKFLEIASYEQRTRLIESMGDLALKRVTDYTRERIKEFLKCLPLFHPAFNQEQERPWIRLNKLADYVAISTNDGLPEFQYTGNNIETIFVDKDGRGVLPLLKAFYLAEIPSKAELLEDYVIPSLETTTGDTKDALSRYILNPRNLKELDLNEGTLKRLKSIKFIPVQGDASVLKSPSELVDSSNNVAKLYFQDEYAFPRDDFLQNFREGLKRLGMITEITDTVVYDRLRKYSRSINRVKEVSLCLEVLLNERPKPPQLGREYLELKWIPASMDEYYTKGTGKLFSASECRDCSRKKLVKYVLPLTKLDFGRPWIKELGWDQPPNPDTIIKQIEMAVAKSDNAVIASLLESGWLVNQTIQSRLEQIAWIPGISGGYYRRSDIFQCNAKKFHPFLDVLSPEVSQHFPERESSTQYFSVEKEPSLDKLRELQDKLASKKQLSGEALQVFVYLLEEVAVRFSDADFSSWKVPDIDGVMHEFCEITVGTSRNDEESQDAIIKTLHFLHPTIGKETIDLLKFPTVQDRFLEKRVGPEFIQDFEQGQKLTTIISDALQRYPIEDTFNEYLANAEDSGGAHKITWAVDAKSKHPKGNLITSKLKDCMGEAILCHNDGIFSRKDLDSLTDIGNSSKRDESSKIGRFGRGSLTMYHWTCVPSFVTGDHFVIMDPEQKRLPNNPTTRQPRKGMLLSIRDVRQLWPDQLRPFEGLFGFTSETEYYKGTIFRFPIMQSKTTSKPSWNLRQGVTVDSALRYLMKYKEDAHIALLFLKNIKSIECLLRDSSGNVTKLWGVSVETDEAPNTVASPDTNILRVRHEVSEYGRGETGSRELLSKAGSEKWLVLTSTVDSDRVPVELQATQQRHKLQARCGIAAQIKGKRSLKTGRLFLDVPTRNTVDLPVHISADLVIQSDRRHFIDLDGSDWNNWMMSSQLATLYMRMLSCLVSNASVSVYNYWPKFPKKTRDPQKTNEQKIDMLLKDAIWRRILSDDLLLFPVEARKDIENSDRTVEHTTTQNALFNLLPPDHIIHSILPRLDLNHRKLVKPVGEAHEGLAVIEETKEHTITFVSPRSVAQLFRSERNCQILQQMLREGKKTYDIELINKLLAYILSGVEPHEIIGCRILPLEDGTLGRLTANSNENYFLIDIKKSQDSALPKLVPGMAVISGLDEMVRAKLLKGNSLNISPFSFQDLPRVLHRLEVTKCTPKVKRDFFVQVWESYQKHGTGEDLEMLQKLPIVAAVSKNPSGYLFLTVDDFREHKYPAMMSIQLSRFESQGQNAMAVFNVLEKHGLLLIDRATFPRWLARTRWVEDEEVDKYGGLYRLLRCIEALCQKSHRSIESFISAEFGREPGLLEKLGDVLGYCNWMYCNNQQHAAYARSLLRNFPIIPCSKRDGSPVRYLSSRNALLEPTTSLNLDSIPRTQYFVCKDWASNHRGELEFLSLEPMSIQDFLMQEFSVEQGSQLPAELLVQYVQILGEIASNMRSVLPIALDGTRRFRFVRTLYDHRNNLFEAAFHHIKDESFLHPKLRNIGWSTMIEQITSNNVYWTCVRGIQIQAENPKYNDATLVDRARRVFDFIRWDTQALRSICEDGRVHSWLNVPFVPAMYVDINNTIRNSTMRGKVPPNRLIAPTAGILSEYADICWSQTPFFCEKPAASVLALLPGQGEPTVQMVLSHLKFLSEKRHEINSSEFPSFIENAKACYRYLQALDQKITVSEDHEIWFNTDEENPDREVFNKSWVSTKNLCLGLEYDSRNLQYVRSSLQSFFPLLKNCNVRTIRGPVASPPPTRKNGDIPYSSTLLTQFQKFRAEQRFIDVYIIIDGRKLGVHKTVLCAASEYFQTMFGNPMREETERIIDWNSAGFTAQTAERLIEWIYTGEMPTITPSDPTDEMEQLLELMGAANCYLLQDLKDFVAHSLRSARYIRPETVLEVKRYAIENDTKGLIKECEEYIAQYWDIIERESADFL